MQDKIESEPVEVERAICDDIQEIVAEYRRQDAEGGVDTPGGLEHMGDVWRLLSRWDAMITATHHQTEGHSMFAILERTRAEHVAWCKQRALKYVEQGSLVTAVTSMLSDMSKHPLTDSPLLGESARTILIDRGANRVVRWINDFH